MNQKKREALEAAGFRIGDAGDFLGLSAPDRRLCELRATLSQAVLARRKEKGFTQLDLAGFLKSSQSRVAKIESGASDVSLDLLFRSLFALGGSVAISNVGKAILPPPKVTKRTALGPKVGMVKAKSRHRTSVREPIDEPST